MTTEALQYILWNPDLFAFHIGSFSVRWYSLCWCFALLAGYFLVQRLYRQQKIDDKLFEPLFFYCFAGILIGARLGHCLFYEPSYFLAHPLEMILPMRETPYGWKFTGYAGLASHGGTLGLMIALWMYVRKTKLNLMRVLDNIAIATPACAMFIRLGNLMNSEIIGKPTDVAWAFIFERVDLLPRHPGQLYEALCYLAFLIIGYILYRKYPQKVGTGFFFGFCLTSIFTARFFIEYTKEVQETWEQSMMINMGQILSIPFIILGLYCMTGGKWCKKIAEKSTIIAMIFAMGASIDCSAQNNAQDAPVEIDHLINTYQFETAETSIQKTIKQLKRRRKSTHIEDAQLERIHQLRNMMKATERITIIDSIVVDRNEVLQAIHLNSECGKLASTSSLFTSEADKDATLYMSALGNKTIFSATDSKTGELHLYSSNLVGNKWSSPTMIDELQADGMQNFPFLMSDGITLYYAAQGENSIGGYDIFVTRYDSDEKKFLLSENMGMPFNSPANDYLLAIDEFNHLGWFVSDRNQSADKVCIYVFIPNDTRKVYDTALYEEAQLAQLAFITSIADTQHDSSLLKEAQGRLAQAINAPQKQQKKHEFSIIIAGNRIYHDLSDFRSSEARKLAQSYLQAEKNYKVQMMQLEALRQQYAKVNASQRQKIATQILALEQKTEQALASLKQTLKLIRQKELS